MAFNPNEHLSKVQKPGDYLQVKWRLVWFRDVHPHGKITTTMVHLDTEKQMAVFKATIEDSEGGVAEGYGSETVKDFKDYIEKAETKAIGRALASLGYGTQFAPEMDEGERIVDSPVDRTPKPAPTAPKPTAHVSEKPAPSATPAKASESSKDASLLPKYKGMADLYYPGGWSALAKQVAKDAHVIGAISDEQIIDEYLTEVQHVLGEIAKQRRTTAKAS